MPELAEVEYFRKQWDKGINRKITAVLLHADKKIFRGIDLPALRNALAGGKLLRSEAHGKQMLFQFSRGWLGIHLGMTGKLRVESAGHVPLKHDHFVLRQAGQTLVFSDPRLFGRVRFQAGKTHPDWWQNRPASILSKEFSAAKVGEFLRRHARAPIKAVLLLQTGFPGIGNWMADEILWQAKIHPSRKAGSLTPAEIKAVRAKAQLICREALRTVGHDYGDLPKSWLFDYRWGANKSCPRDGTKLQRAAIGGRTTCWCPSCQKLRKAQ